MSPPRLNLPKIMVEQTDLTPMAKNKGTDRKLKIDKRPSAQTMECSQQFVSRQLSKRREMKRKNTLHE